MPPANFQGRASSLVVGAAQALALALRGGRDHQPHDEAVQAQRLGKDEDQDHADEEPRLLRVGADAGVAHDADGEAGREGAHADRESSAEVRVARVSRIVCRIHLAVDDHSRDEAVDAEHAGHDDGDDGAHDHVRPHHAHRRDADPRLRGAVGGAEVREDDGGGHAHEPEEGGGGVALLHLEERAGRERRHRCGQNRLRRTA
mmetsp:Transcript_21584/g.59021  ORF Transcript_21584/g.59021 Transcript_21584/m.59021 type:complete len:202 (+) Transcript_21584:130-735(+)